MGCEAMDYSADHAVCGRTTRLFGGISGALVAAMRMGKVMSLFDESGNMVRPWAEAGWRCWCFDILNDGHKHEIFDGGGFISYVRADLDDPSWHQVIEDMQPDRLFSFSPCDDVAVCGAKHFAKKLANNPQCQNIALDRARIVEEIADISACRWMHENPVSILSTSWRKPDFYFDPSDYGGYLPEDDVHPRWPEYIAPRDAYPKKTGIRCGGGFVIPERRPVHAAGHFPGWKKLGGKSAKTKQIRSETPRGFALAVYEANAE